MIYVVWVEYHSSSILFQGKTDPEVKAAAVVWPKFESIYGHNGTPTFGKNE